MKKGEKCVGYWKGRKKNYVSYTVNKWRKMKINDDQFLKEINLPPIEKMRYLLKKFKEENGCPYFNKVSILYIFCFFF